MSRDTVCIHDESGKHIGQICFGTGRHYLARTHWRGYQKWNVISRHRSRAAALRSMTAALERDQFANRGDVLFCADYYDAIQIYELVKR